MQLIPDLVTPAPPNFNVDFVSSTFHWVGVYAEHISQVEKQSLHRSTTTKAEKQTTLKLGGEGGGQCEIACCSYPLRQWPCWAFSFHLRNKFRQLSDRLTFFISVGNLSGYEEECHVLKSSRACAGGCQQCMDEDK